MSTTIDITISTNLARLIREGPGRLILRALARAMDLENELTIGAAVKDRMSFPRTGPSTLEGLRVQTGLLRRSLRRSNATITGNLVESAIGSNVKYFGPHEFGYDGEQQVKQHQRKAPDRIQADSQHRVSFRTAHRLGLLTKRGQARKGYQVIAGGVHTVKAFKRKLHLPARRMVFNTVLARSRNYARTMEREVVKELGGA